jgi:DNA-directed RNA polymerase subunit RPC12/RpoP
MNRSAPMKPLVRCPSCASGLIYPVSHATWEGQSVLDRRCPDCEHRDLVVTNRLVAAVWLRRCEAAAQHLSTLADALADGCWFELEPVNRPI